MLCSLAITSSHQDHSTATKTNSYRRPYALCSMALTSVPLPALPLAVMAIALELAAASHFRGAIIQWRPVDPDNFDGRVSTYN